MITYIYLFFTVIFLSSCGSSQTTSDSKNNTGYLVDAKVAGVEYYCNDLSGITANDGSFLFNYSCNDIIFKLGSITLATMKVANVQSDNIFYITDITQRSSRNDTNNIPVKNIIRLLQTLDDDNNPENGINITQTIRNNITNNITYDVSSSNINDQDLKNIILDAGLNKELVNSTKALVHFEQTLRDNNINVDTVPPYIPYLTNTILSTSTDTTVIDINGEKYTKIYINNIYTNKSLNSNGKYTNFDLNTSYIKNTFGDFNISLLDNTGKMSEILNLKIFKDTDDFDSNSTATFPPNTITVTAPNKFIWDINITDNSTRDYNLSLVYTIGGNDKDLFDINNTNGILSFKNSSITGQVYNITLSVSDLAKHKLDGNITITVN